MIYRTAPFSTTLNDLQFLFIRIVSEVKKLFEQKHAARQVKMRRSARTVYDPTEYRCRYAVTS